MWVGGGSEQVHHKNKVLNLLWGGKNLGSSPHLTKVLSKGHNRGPIFGRTEVLAHENLVTKAQPLPGCHFLQRDSLLRSLQSKGILGRTWARGPRQLVKGLGRADHVGVWQNRGPRPVLGLWFLSPQNWGLLTIGVGNCFCWPGGGQIYIDETAPLQITEGRGSYRCPQTQFQKLDVRWVPCDSPGCCEDQTSRHPSL